MADSERCNQLAKAVKQILAYQAKALVSRPEWGTISFKGAEHDLKRIFSLLAYLDVLPLEYLPDQAVDQVRQAVDQVRPHLEQIEKFSIEQSNATQTRDNLVNQVHQAADRVYTTAAAWVPFLAYQKGDVTQNIERLSTSVTKANEMVEKAKADIHKKSEEITDIITKAREASAAAGAAVFTTDFADESKRQERGAHPWLWATGCLAVATLAVAVITWFWTQVGLDDGQVWQKVSSKLIALSVLMTGTFWCGKMYKAHMHQSVVNRHRALGLRTFQAFSAAASDEQTKNAVLLETTRSIFAPGMTGLVDQRGSGGDGDARIVEIAKSVIAREE